MQEQNFTFRLATTKDKPAIIAFMNTHWGQLHPLVNNEKFFNFYYTTFNNQLNFAIAECEGEIASIAGFIPSNHTTTPDIWVSLWVSHPAYSGAGLALMAEMQSLTQCRTLACNNIRPKTQVLYQFLGYTTGRINHFYRLANRESYKIAKINHFEIARSYGNAILQKVETEKELAKCKPVLHASQNPYKDIKYIAYRYFSYPYQKYTIWHASDPATCQAAILVTRTTLVEANAVLRIVDYIGEPTFFAELGTAIDSLMENENVEYADFYCVGIPKSSLQKAGFTERTEKDTNIIPNYLTPLSQENIDFYYFTNNPEHFTLFKADGDQDRPNIES